MSADLLRLAIVGARGRMGQALVRLAGEHPGLEAAVLIDQGDDIGTGIAQVDAVIEFAHHALTPRVAEAAAAAGKALVIGTTGHTETERAAITVAAQKIPVVFAPNFSVGVNLLFHLTRIAAQTLGEEFDREIVEMHHRLKIDAPSGTARRLGEILAETAGGSYEELVQHGRSGDVGQRPRGAIGMHAVRGGDVVGDHSVIFAGEGERLELSHRASSRDTFASGALRAALWATQQPAGLYSMQDVLGLK